MATPGYHLMPGAGHHSIMAGGYIAIGMAGYGSPAMNGALHGFAGDLAEAIMAGHLWAHGSLLPLPLAIITAPLTGGYSYRSIIYIVIIMFIVQGNLNL